MKLTVHQFDLPLRHTFTIARGSTTVSRTLIVELEHDGVSGYGEAGENDFYGASIPDMKAALEAVRPLLEAKGPTEPAELWTELESEFGPKSFPQCALDLAAWDLWGKLRQQPLWKLWGLNADDLPATDYTIGIDTIDVMVRKMEEFPGWPIYKIKLGTDDDIAIVRELRKHTDAVFRVDANCAWTVDQTIENSHALAELGVEFHRAAHGAKELGRHGASLQKVGSALDRRRKLPTRGRRGPLCRLFPRRECETRQMRRFDSS